MASPTYSTQGIVLRKTKLGEADLILSLLLHDGSRTQVVAKGARKPTSPFSSRLELFSLTDLLCVKTRSLDIVKEARLVCGNEHLRTDIALSTAAAPVVELAYKLAQESLANPKLFACTKAALEAMDSLGSGEAVASCVPSMSDTPTSSAAPASAINTPDTTNTPDTSDATSASTSSAALALCAAYILKGFAFAGLRISFERCAMCGSAAFPALQIAQSQNSQMLNFSYEDGGLICSNCRANQGLSSSVVRIEAFVCVQAATLMHAKFADIARSPQNISSLFSVLEVYQQWACYHIGTKLKSLNFLFTSGLF